MFTASNSDAMLVTKHFCAVRQVAKPTKFRKRLQGARILFQQGFVADIQYRWPTDLNKTLPDAFGYQVSLGQLGGCRTQCLEGRFGECNRQTTE